MKRRHFVGGLAAAAGLADEAAATFSLAVEAGFDDFQAAFDDPDLAGLRALGRRFALSERDEASCCGITPAAAWC